MNMEAKMYQFLADLKLQNEKMAKELCDEQLSEAYRTRCMHYYNCILGVINKLETILTK